jgi:hypothetical protein
VGDEGEDFGDEALLDGGFLLGRLLAEALRGRDGDVRVGCRILLSGVGLRC